ncbi:MULTISPECIES: AraC family transcriptional regulator ligand-binding domain-containing protein [unclassified Streptomyces]|uniref:AraC family transcriptional regulator n=1 Tax=unclassified Streptomyces TaxID=2593676 RepID=UPI00381CE34A
MHDRSRPTVAASYARAVAQRAADRSSARSSGSLLTADRHDGAPVPPHHRLDLSDVQSLWAEVLDHADDARTGLSVGLGIRPSAFHVLGHLLLDCATLADAAALAVEYHALVSEAGEVTFRRGPALSRLVYRPVEAARPMVPPQVEAVLAGVVTAGGWVAGPGWVPEAVHFTHPCAGTVADYERALGCAVVFGADVDEVVVRTADLDLTRSVGDGLLASLHREHADRLLAELALSGSVRLSVSRWLGRGDLREVRAADAAAARHVSERTLRRVLGEEGTSWRELLDTARHERAALLLRTTDMTLTGVARRTGLGSPAALVRAFTRWEGLTPGAYREGWRRPTARGGPGERADGRRVS